MWLLITAAAAIAAGALRYAAGPADKYKLGFLSLVFGGATMMWLVDHIIGYVEEGGPFFDMSARAAALGVCVLALGIVVWLVRLVVSDPRRVLGLIGRK